MILAEDHGELRSALANAAGPIALVPTMGNLHAGHLALASLARQRAGTVVASLFVNPTQFAPGEDFERYPRTFETDREQLAAVGADVLFAPTVEDMYPFGTDGSVRVSVPALGDDLCGAARAGHFDGVATIVSKLFCAVQPDLAIFGMKDYQQLLIIERLVTDLGMGIEIVRGETVREPDGLALSSRNGYLAPEDRARAPVIYRALGAVRDAVGNGAGLPAALTAGHALLAAAGIVPEYLTVRRAADLGEPDQLDRRLVVLTAARVGAARLIDNVVFER